MNFLAIAHPRRGYGGGSDKEFWQAILVVLLIAVVVAGLWLLLVWIFDRIYYRKHNLYCNPKWRWWKFWLVALFICGCAAPRNQIALPSMPQSRTALVQAMPERRWMLTWEYPTSLPTPGIEFDVEVGPTPEGPWTKFATVSAPPVPIPNEDAYYRAGAHFVTP